METSCESIGSFMYINEKNENLEKTLKGSKMFFCKLAGTF